MTAQYRIYWYDQNKNWFSTSYCHDLAHIQREIKGNLEYWKEPVTFSVFGDNGSFKIGPEHFGLTSWIQLDFVPEKVQAQICNKKKNMKQTIMARYWINQPSTLQNCHDLHGQIVIAPEKLSECEDFITVYFVKGLAISARIPKIALSKFHEEIV